MHFIFAADNHGNLTQYKKIFNYAENKKIPLIIFGGDLTPKSPELRTPEKQKEFLQKHLFPLIQNYYGKVLLILGNDDYKRNLNFLENTQQEIGFSLLYHPLFIDNFYFVGYSYVPYTPFKWKDWERRDLKTDTIKNLRADASLTGFIDYDIPYNIINGFENHSIEDDLEKLISDIPAGKLVLITHAPPSDTNTDLIKDSNGNLLHVGSRAIRKIIEKKQPVLSLHGHIHDTVQNSGIFPDYIGKTKCCAVSNNHIGVNPFIVEINTLPQITVERKML